MYTSIRTPAAYRMANHRGAWVRGAWLRAAAVVTYGAAAFVGDAAWQAWVAVAIATVGSYLALSAAYAVEDEQPWARPGIVYKIHQATHGKFIPGMPAVTEYAGLILMGYCIRWIPGLPGLVAQIAAVVMFGSAWINLWADPAFYTSRHASATLTRLLDLGRAVSGPLGAVLAASVTVAPWLPGPTPVAEQYVLAALVACGAVSTVGARLRDIDQLAAHSNVLVADTEKAATDYVRDLAHGLMGAPVASLGNVVAESHPWQWTQFYGAYSEYVQKDANVESAQALRGAVERKTRAAAVTLAYYEFPADVIAGTDREVARIVLLTLVDNAVKAGATWLDVRLHRVDNDWEVHVSDDGAAISDEAWQMKGGGLSRIRGVVSPLGGSLRMSTGLDATPHPDLPTPATKTISAWWPAQ